MARTPSSKTPFEAYIDKLNAAPGRVGILTEGDSWFALPLPGRPNVVDVLIRQLGSKAAWLRLEKTSQRFHHVRTQGTLDDTEWGDEIHPSKVGFEKIAAKVRTALAERFPSLG
jgi:hypothetical protein